jgi:hypothetical protein
MDVIEMLLNHLQKYLKIFMTKLPDSTISLTEITQKYKKVEKIANKKTITQKNICAFLLESISIKS